MGHRSPCEEPGTWRRAERNPAARHRLPGDVQAHTKQQRGGARHRRSDHDRVFDPQRRRAEPAASALWRGHPAGVLVLRLGRRRWGRDVHATGSRQVVHRRPLHPRRQSRDRRLGRGPDFLDRGWRAGAVERVDAAAPGGRHDQGVPEVQPEELGAAHLLGSGTAAPSRRAEGGTDGPAEEEWPTRSTTGRSVS